MPDRRKSVVLDERAQDLAEYGIALGIVGVVAVAAALAIGVQVGKLWDASSMPIVSAAHGNNGHHHGGGNSGNGGGNGAGNG